MGTFGVDIDREPISGKELNALCSIQRRLATIRTLEPSLNFGANFSKGQISKLVDIQLYPRFGDIDTLLKNFKDLRNSAGNLVNYDERTKEAFSEIYSSSETVINGILRAKRSYFSKLPKIK